jgi:hypothetical protein
MAVRLTVDEEGMHLGLSVFGAAKREISCTFRAFRVSLYFHFLPLSIASFLFLLAAELQ